MERERYYELDFLRFVAAFAVLLFHYVFRVWNLDGSGYLAYPLLSGFSKYGYLGVDAFFMISGFVILMSADGRNAWGFAVSRIVRLYPAYWFCTVVIFAFATLWPVHDYKPTFADFLLNLTMFHSWFGAPHVSSVFWTLIVEMQFYLIVLVLIQTGLIRRLNLFLGVWLGLTIASDYLPFPAWLKTLLIASWSYYFIAGATFYLIRKQGLSVYRLALLGLCLWEAVRHGYWYVLLKERLSGVDYDPVIAVGILVSLFGLFFLVALRRLPGNYRQLARLGVLTYPLYLIHALIGETLLVDYVTPANRYIGFVLVTAAMLLFAYWINRYIERLWAPRLKAVLTR
ncbi:acyltransferase family protein [Motiliproteus sp.]|uniref:acyltransferase family protein n=1 Tax=Motiliproteus sp. TaxID=1898955 RepID=UPI003BAD2B1D